MKRPDFDATEAYFVDYYRKVHRNRGGNSWLTDLAFLIVGIGLFVFGLSQQHDPTWSIIGFGILTFRFIQYCFVGLKHERTLAAIIDKYEETFEADPDKPPRSAEQDESPKP